MHPLGSGAPHLASVLATGRDPRCGFNHHWKRPGFLLSTDLVDGHPVVVIVPGNFSSSHKLLLIIDSHAFLLQLQV